MSAEAPPPAPPAAAPQYTELERFLWLVSDPFRAEFSQNSILASVGTSLGTTALIFVAWMLIRPYNTIVYAPKLRGQKDEKNAPPRLEPGIFAWFKPLWRTTDADLVDQIGVDAVLFLRVLRMCRDMLGILGFLSIAIMVPVNVIMSKRNNWPGGPTDPWTLMSPRIAWGKGMWAHVVMAWVFDFIIMYMLWVNYKAVANMRRNYFESEGYQMALSSRTLMVRLLNFRATSCPC